MSENKQLLPMVRVHRNDQDITRAIDLGIQIRAYRGELIEAGIAPAQADQMCFRLNEYLLIERFQPPLRVVNEGQRG